MTARAVVVLVALALAVACGGDAPPPQDTPNVPDEAATTPASEPDGDLGTEVTAPAEPLRAIRVRIYFPAADGTDLVGEEREIFDTAAPGDRAKQILSDLISGPEGKDALPAMPRGVRLRQVFVLPDGVAYADFSRELIDLTGGGTAEELTTVYAIVNSVALNVREIRRVGILVDGGEIETLAGHLDLRVPLPPRPDLVREQES